MSKTFFLSFIFLNIGILFAKSFSPTGWKYNDNITEQKVKMPKNILKGLKHGSDMMLVDGGSFKTKSTEIDELWIDPADTVLVLQPYSYKITVNPFYISNHEVTNFEYRTFVKWVIDSISRAHPENPKYCYYADNELMNAPAINTNKIEYDNVNIYPDTLCWYRPNHTYNYTFDLEHLRHIYFMHRFFNNYPVVGVNWYQAMAYCKWKTMRLKEEALKKKKTINAVFRLPTQAEWQYASTVRKHKIGAITYEVEDDSFFSLWDKKGKLRYNIVSIIDKNGSTIYTNTQNIFTASVKSFPCNYFKLYHLRGNVSEWMLDKPSESQFLFYNYTRLQGDTLAYSEQITKQLNQLTDKTKKIELLTTLLNDINRKLKNHFVDEESEQLNNQVNVLSDLRNKLIFSNSDLRIIKGGSWEDGVIYQQAVACELINANTKRRSTGFRIAMSVSEE